MTDSDPLYGPESDGPAPPEPGTPEAALVALWARIRAFYELAREWLRELWHGPTI